MMVQQLCFSYDNAFECYDAANKNDPLNSNVYYNCALLHFNFENLGDAYSDAQKALSLNSNYKKAQPLLTEIADKMKNVQS
jgi:tetratricopeptide (TPR) repeat protein